MNCSGLEVEQDFGKQIRGKHIVRGKAGAKTRQNKHVCGGGETPPGLGLLGGDGQGTEMGDRVTKGLGGKNGGSILPLPRPHPFKPA